MNDLRAGRFSMFAAIIGVLAMLATLVAPPILVLFAVFAGAAGIAGWRSVRTNAARIGLILALVVLPLVTLLCLKQNPATIAGNVSVRFSPNGGCTDAIVAAIKGARRTIHVQAYSFTSSPIAQALVAAHRRGVVVRVILDKSHQTARYSGAKFLYNMGIVPQIDHDHRIAHNKILIVDEAVVITGSMNFSRAGEESNAENLLILRDTHLTAQYLQNWRDHSAHSLPYVPTGTKGESADTSAMAESEMEE